MLFSQRIGIKPAQKVLQLESMDDDLRNGLWNALQISLWGKYSSPDYYGQLDDPSRALVKLTNSFWLSFFKKPIDDKPNSFQDCFLEIRGFFFRAQWNEVYDFIEFAQKHVAEGFKKDLRSVSNLILERENAAYRFVGDELLQISSTEEIAAVEEAFKSPFDPVNVHLQAAVSLLADRKKPDFRNSIKESISAVESIAKLVANNPKGTLGEAIKVLRDKAGLHPALEKAFSAIYGYSSDENGIRHALLDESKVSYSDAKFMLIACSGFINYVVGKAAEVGLKLGKSKK